MTINSTNPLTAAQNAVSEATSLAYPHEAIVVSAPTKESEQPAHGVRVAGVTFNGQKDASVLTPVEGDTNIPPEGSRVLVSFVRGEKPVVIGQLYSEDNGDREFSNSAPPYNQSRRLGDPHSNSHIEFTTENIIHIESDDGTTVDVDPTDGTVRVNDATQGVVTDIEVKSRNKYNGITAFDIIRSDDLFAE
jgi:hypothetical protein